MAKTRLDLDAEFREVLGSNNVYHQPPANIHMSYPCIVYEENPDEDLHADNDIFMTYHNWSVTLIRNYTNRDETKKLVDKIKSHFKPYIRVNQHFVTDNLIHDVFKLYY